MSQATNVIASGTGAAVRTAINAALAAILSQHSGTSRPSYITAFQFWFDTSTPGSGVGTLKMYDGASDVAIGTLDATGHVWTPALPAVISATAFVTGSGNVNNQTGTSYSLVAADNGKLVTMNNASANILTVPASLGAGFSCSVMQLGAGQTTIAASSTILRQRNGLKCAGQYAIAGVLWLATDTYGIGGDVSP